MSEGWIKLTSEFEEGFVSTYREFAGAHQFGVGLVEDDEIKGVHVKSLLSTSELANIPWVRALIVTARKEVQDQSKGTERIKAWYEGTKCEAAINNALDYVGSSLRNDLDAALKPFKDVTYE